MIGFLKKLFSVRPVMDDEVMSVLSETRLFDNLSLADLERLSEVIEMREYEAGEVLFQQGDHGDGMYIIANGTVEIRLGEKKIALLHEREFFGEIALIDESGRRTATVMAHNACRCLFLSREHFEQLMVSHVTAAKILYQLCRVLSKRLARTSRAAAKQMEPEPAPATAVDPPPPVAS